MIHRAHSLPVSLLSFLITPNTAHPTKWSLPDKEFCTRRYLRTREHTCGTQRHTTLIFTVQLLVQIPKSQGVECVSEEKPGGATDICTASFQLSQRHLLTQLAPVKTQRHVSDTRDAACASANSSMACASAKRRAEKPHTQKNRQTDIRTHTHVRTSNSNKLRTLARQFSTTRPILRHANLPT